MDPFLKDKSRVARRFARAAAGYERASMFQNTVSERLVERLDYMKLDPRQVLDLGSGTGRGARALSKRFRRARVLQLDLAPAMLAQGRPGPLLRRFARAGWICGDVEQLPLKAASVDLVFSSLMLQWCNDVDRAFLEVARVLRQGGLFIFSTLGPDTLAELRESWAKVDGQVHVNAFLDMHDVGDALVRAGLADPVMEVERFTLTYDDGHALMHDLRQLGTSNSNRGAARGLTGKGRIRQMLDHYEAFRTAGKLPATYEVVYGHAWGSGMAQAKDPHTAVFPVEALRRRGAGRHDG